MPSSRGSLAFTMSPRRSTRTLLDVSVEVLPEPRREPEPVPEPEPEPELDIEPEVGLILTLSQNPRLAGHASGQ